MPAAQRGTQAAARPGRAAADALHRQAPDIRGDERTMTRPPAIPEPGKPLTEMTRDELAQWRRSFRRWQRDNDVAAGRRTPSTMREMEIWENSVTVLEQRRDLRAAGVAEDELPALPYEGAPGSLLPFGERTPRQRQRRRRSGG